MTNHLEMGCGWETGLVRKFNEDSIFCASFNLSTHSGTLSAGLFAVADGMGGHNAGEVASDLAIRTFHSEVISGLLDLPATQPTEILAEAFKMANSAVFYAAGDRSLRGMGTTLTAALVLDQDMYLAHIGDSRCYIINSRETLHITSDHSVVQQLVDEGVITPEAARNHPRRNEITRVLGYSAEAQPDLLQVKLYAGDNVLLCSDGLCGVLEDDTISRTVLNSPDPQHACSELTKQANLAGGPDNISVIIIKPGNLPSWQAMIAAQTSLRKA